jgi:two-component sensor histidine kinase
LRYLHAFRHLPPFAGALFAAISVGAAGVVRERLSGPLHGHPFLLFFPAIILTSLLFGGGAGFVAVVLSVFAAAWVVEPERSLLLSWEQVPSLILFAVTAFICAAAIELLQVATRENIEGEERLKTTQASEQSQETRLAETLHRVRNDLGALASLLTLQSRRRPEAADALAAAANQIRVLGRLHSRFSLAADGEAVVFCDDFLRELVRDLETTHFGEGGVRLEVEAEREALPLRTASTLGLIVNELVTNAAKYAFPNGRGAIRVSFRRAEGVDTLIVADDGVGPGDRIQGSGMGSDLLHRLAGQLGGEFRRERGPNGRGTTGIETVPVEPIAPTPTDAEAGRPASAERQE